MLSDLENEIGALDVERFTEADLIEALLRAQHDQGLEGAMTTAELMDALGRSDKWVRNRLRPLIASGRVARSKKPFEKIDGTVQLVSAYVLVAE